MPISVIEPASVVMWAIGSITSRAGMLRVCSRPLVAGISMATIGVVFISADATPTGAARRRNACCAVSAWASNRRVIRDTTPVCTTPLAMTSIAPTVITPPLLSPPYSAEAGAMPRMPATTSAQPSAITGRTMPSVITVRVATTITAPARVCHMSAAYELDRWARSRSTISSRYLP